MKKFFTLFVTIACSTLTSFGQVTQNFETVPNLTGLTGSCWQFSGVSLESTNGRSLALNPTTNGTTAWAMTPYINLTASSTIKFTYKLAKALTTGASRKVAVQLLGLDGKYTPVATVSLTEIATTSNYTFSAKSPMSGVQKIVIEVTASGNNATAIMVDDLEVAGDYNYNAPYGCKERGDGTLSIHYLKTFQGLLNGDKVQLQWTVAENENNNYFEIEKSLDNIEFKTVATIQATTKAGEASYTHTDLLQAKAYYRLKVISKTNIRMYSNVVVFKTDAGSSANLAVLQNPIQESLKFGFISNSKAQAVVNVYSLSGIKVYQTSFQAYKGYNVITTPLEAAFRGGAYLLEVSTADNRATAKFLKN